MKILNPLGYTASSRGVSIQGVGALGCSHMRSYEAECQAGNSLKHLFMVGGLLKNWKKSPAPRFLDFSKLFNYLIFVILLDLADFQTTLSNHYLNHNVHQ